MGIFALFLSFLCYFYWCNLGTIESLFSLLCVSVLWNASAQQQQLLAVVLQFWNGAGGSDVWTPGVRVHLNTLKSIAFLEAPLFPLSLAAGGEFTISLSSLTHSLLHPSMLQTILCLCYCIWFDRVKERERGREKFFYPLQKKTCI